MNSYLPALSGRQILLSNAAIGASAGILVSAVWALLSLRIGFDLSDEGYLWYGTQRLFHGEFPIRDFLAYDLGRYLYSSVFFLLLQDTGLISLRIAAFTLIGVLMVGVAYIVISNENAKWLMKMYIALTVAILAGLLVYPYYKVFDYVAALSLILAIYNLFKRPSVISWIFLGVTVGIAATVNRNHGVYGVVASILAFSVFLAMPRMKRQTFRTPFVFAFGVAIGYLPTLLSFVFVSGFFQSFLEGIREQLRLGQTNIPLPVPWPWIVDLRVFGWLTSFPPFLRGLAFLGLILFPIFGLMVILKNRRAFDTKYAAFTASLCVAIPYSHYAFSRADMTHLSLSLLPVFIGLLTIPLCSRSETKGLVAILLITITVVISQSPAVEYYAETGLGWEKIKVRGESILVRKSDAESFGRITNAIEKNIRSGSTFVAMPDMPGVHAIFESRIPVYDIYTLSVADKMHEEAEINKLNQSRPGLILISNKALDSSELLRFSNLRPQMYKWLNENYRRTVSADPQGNNAFEFYALE